ncbi:MAG: nucleoside hydrolase [Clostridium sp.]
MSSWINYKFEVPKERRVRYIVHTDCKNEADDQFTLCHALMTDKLDVKGIIAGHFDKGNGNRFPEKKTACASYDEIKKIMSLMDLTDHYPVFLGAPEGLPDETTPIITEAAEFIVKEAMKDDPRPLYIGMQGAITDLASAILMEPEICSRMTCIWIGGGDYPLGGPEFNLANDICGANVSFNQRCRYGRSQRAYIKSLQYPLPNCRQK